VSVEDKDVPDEVVQVDTGPVLLVPIFVEVEVPTELPDVPVAALVLFELDPETVVLVSWANNEVEIVKAKIVINENFIGPPKV
jgi:hypothetical protein